MVVTTLDAMASGGMYDHLGGGFARYSVDGRWLVPHFEKMLYDQALLVRAYLHAWQVTGEDRFLQVLTETIDYVRRDLRHPDGGFYSSEDADSEGHEGTFYVWTVEELRALLGDDVDAAIEWWGVSRPGNFEGKNILHRPVRGDLRAAGGHRAGPPDAVRRPGEAGPARPRRQGAGRVERAVPVGPGRGGRRHRPGGLAGRRPDQRRVPPPQAAPAGGRALAAGVAGRQARPPPGPGRRLRGPGRRLHPPGRGHRRGPVGRPGPGTRPTP